MNDDINEFEIFINVISRPRIPFRSSELSWLIKKLALHVFLGDLYFTEGMEKY